MRERERERERETETETGRETETEREYSQTLGYISMVQTAFVHVTRVNLVFTS